MWICIAHSRKITSNALNTQLNSSSVATVGEARVHKPNPTANEAVVTLASYDLAT